ncbi:hypothetical protein [Gloeobacter kilaueensis]|uniref:Uncharacterized protein n=1 Tax=Gloeobacter kilaueensis (strain ATCC BAA-2537 / CCAP 1431/1 / ULC 316 / JS1) TaxID=1183438 RepID=U5QCB2_GLOK1|nr:hypothetical protein [Gloeobacter kilaueensis]AGY56468.1 hypothetical protein GKIL_0221 [Gloeobacter kilaueensis JS1]
MFCSPTPWASALLYPSRAYLPGKVRAAINFLRQHLGQGKYVDEAQ